MINESVQFNPDVSNPTFDSQDDSKELLLRILMAVDFQECAG